MGYLKKQPDERTQQRNPAVTCGILKSFAATDKLLNHPVETGRNIKPSLKSVARAGFEPATIRL